MRHLLLLAIVTLSFFNALKSKDAAIPEALLSKLSIVNAEWPKQPECNNIVNNGYITDNKSYDDWIVTHLMLVEKTLRARDVTRLSSSQQRNRKKLLNELNYYWHVRAFPVNDYTNYKTPVFIDRTGNHCAVGYLMQQSGYEKLAREINAHQKFAYVRDINVDGVKKWADKMGFTLDELAWIQPSYDPTTILTPLGNGTNGAVAAMYSDYFAGKGLVFGGSFDSVNNLPCASIGFYTGNQLNCLGGGINGLVNCIDGDSRIIKVAGDFQFNGNHFPLAEYDSVWNFCSIPGKANSVATALDLDAGNFTVEIALNDSATGQTEIWDSLYSGGWQKQATVNGVIYHIENSPSGLIYVGAFDSAIIFTYNLSDTIETVISVNNVVFRTENLPGPDTWLGIEGQVSDTVLFARSLGAAVYFAGSCSSSNGRSNVCLTRYLNGTLQPLILSGFLADSISSRITDIEYYGSSDLIIAGEFAFSPLNGTGGNNLAYYDATLDYITPMGIFNNKVACIANQFDNWFIGGEFTTDEETFPYGMQTLSHLAQIDNATGIKELSANNTIHIYPNPTAGYIHIQIPDDEVLTQIELSDITGRTVYAEQQIPSSKNISVTELPSGIYLLYALTNNGWFAAKVVKE